MQTSRNFIEKIQNIYGNQYNIDQLQVIVSKTKNYSQEALSYAVNSLIEKFKTLPSVPNVLEHCENGAAHNPIIIVSKQNNMTAQSFKVSQAIYNGWFSDLKIDLNGHKCTITPRNEKNNAMPSKIFETYIMTHLLKNLLFALPDDVELIEWNYLGYYKNKIYTLDGNFA